MDRLDNMKSHLLGNGTSQCLLCGEEFGLLGASASECEECSKVAMPDVQGQCINMPQLCHGLKSWVGRNLQFSADTANF